VPIFEISDFHLVFFLCLVKNCVPVKVEFLVLLHVGLLDFLLALLVREHQVLVFHVKFLFFKLEDAVLGQLSLCDRWRERVSRLKGYLPT